MQRTEKGISIGEMEQSFIRERQLGRESSTNSYTYLSRENGGIWRIKEEPTGKKLWGKEGCDFVY